MLFYTAGAMQHRGHPLLILCVLVLSACGSSPTAVRIVPQAEGLDPAGTVLSDPAPAPHADPVSAPAHVSVAVSALGGARGSADMVVPREPVDAVSDAEILAPIEAALGTDTEHYSVVVRRLRDGRGATLNPHRQFYAASLFKLALLYETQRKRSAGLLDFDLAVPVTARDVEEDLGTFDQLGIAVGDSLPVRNLVQAMVTHSDNTSAVLLLYLLGPAAVDRTLLALGLQATSVNTRDLPTTAADMALLMEMIVRGVGVEPAWREEMLSLLSRQETRAGIPRLLPADVRVGNKTGTWPGATHDVAFVEAPAGTYVLAVLSDRSWEWDAIARISRALYDVIGNRQ